MPFTLQGVALQRARITVPRHQVWEGEVAAVGELDIAVGSAVSLVLGDLTLSGYVVAGGTFPGASESTYTLAGGAAGWTKAVQARPYSVPGGVRLADVVAQLATDAGELFDLTQISASAQVGAHWQRQAGPASVALSELFPLDTGGWRIDPDGYARPGPRPPAPLPPDMVGGRDFVVEDAPRGKRWARLSIGTDRVSPFLPGAIVTAPTLGAPIVVGELTIRAAMDSVTVEVLGEAGMLEMFAGLVQAVAPRPALSGLYRYQVSGTDPGAPTLTPVDAKLGLPPVLACSKVYGLPGVTATLALGTVAVVAFLDGSPSLPVAVAYLSGQPSSVTIDASNLISLGVGGGPLTLSGPLITWAALVNGGLAAAGHAVAPLGDCATTKAMGV